MTQGIFTFWHIFLLLLSSTCGAGLSLLTAYQYFEPHPLLPDNCLKMKVRNLTFIISFALPTLPINHLDQCFSTMANFKMSGLQLPELPRELSG